MLEWSLWSIKEALKLRSLLLWSHVVVLTQSASVLSISFPLSQIALNVASAIEDERTHTSNATMSAVSQKKNHSLYCL